MVTAEDAKDALEAAHRFANGDPQECIYEFFLASHRAPEDEENTSETVLEIEEVPFHSAIHTELTAIFVSELYKVVNAVTKKESKALARYDPGNIEEDPVPIQYLPVDEIPNYNIFHPFTKKAGFDETSPEDIENADFQAFRVRDKWGDMFVGFRKFTRRQIVGSSWKVKLLLEDNEFDIFEHNLLALPQNIDAFVYNDMLFVINQGQFEDIFDYFTEYESTAEAVLDEFDEADFTIHNMQLFKEDVMDDKTALRKMTQVKDMGLYKDLTQENVKGIVEDYDLDLDLEHRDGEWGINYQSKSDKKDIIRLLNEDTIYGAITEEKYISTGGKRPI